MRNLLFVLSLALACQKAPAEPTPAEREKAAAAARPGAMWQPLVDARDRTESDRKLDEGRHPAELLEFLNLKPGMKVAELGAGSGYTTELIARAVAPSGAVYAQNPKAFLDSFLKDSWPARLGHPAMKDVVRVDRELDDPFPPAAKNLDAVVMNGVYRDTVQLEVDREKMNRAVFAALQPGGAYVILDSSAAAGRGAQDAQALHRIDEKLVREEVQRAGFRLDAEASFLRNSKDTRDWDAAPAPGGEQLSTSDRFALRFVKPADGRAEPVPPRLRLPAGIRPVRYSPQLTIVPTSETFDGTMTIELELDQPAPVLWLNADTLSVKGTSPRARIVAGGNDFVGLEFDQPLPAGKTQLKISWQGQLSRKDGEGAYKQQENGEWYVLTQFEPLGARRVFPSFDEPAFKVPWQLTLRVRKSDAAYANTPPESEAQDGDFKTIRFAETKPLPSYLVAFGVGPFEAADGGTTEGGVPVRIVVTKGKKEWAKYSAASTGKLLDLLAAYYGIPYSYGKLDLIEVPLGGGAMENPGLVTFAQRINLVKPGEETPQFRRAAASVEAHELAHQWFGDLVTTAWWDDLWLNEAFATWMTPKTLDRYRPEWNADASRVLGKRSAMIADQLVSARRIRQPIESNDDIKTAFDGITYQKGAAVIGMFEAYVGAEAFQRGVHRFLSEHAHRNATAKEFLAAISAEAGKDVAPAFSTFLDQGGIPLVSAKLTCEGGKGRLALEQERYLPIGSEGAPEDQRWQIPVCAKYPRIKSGPARECTLLTAKTGILELPACPAWVLPNDGETGYYRLALDGMDLARLSKNLAALTVPERLGLLYDVQAMAYAGRLDYGQVLAFVLPVAGDKSRFVAEAAIQIVSALRDAQLAPPEQQAKVAALVRATFGKRAHALGLAQKKGEDEDATLLRPHVAWLVGDAGQDPQLLAEARRLTEAWLHDRTAIGADMVQVTLALAAAHGDRPLFDKLRAAARAEPSRPDRQRVLAALGAFRDPAIAAEALKLTLSDELDPRETIGILFARSSEPETRQLAWDFLRSNFDALAARLPRDSAAGFPPIGAAFCDEEHRPEVEAFFKDRAPKYVGGPRRLAQALESMKLCSAARTRLAPGVAAFLEQQR